ncbi:MAG: flagellar hook-length control protein FliK, partial [Desulfobacterales bacterium]|nr:flagellar hook-length control protein FliK [Desulfobacterales bacterium]
AEDKESISENKLNIKAEDKESISENKLNIKADKPDKANLSDVSNVKVKTEDKESILSENKLNIKADKPAKANLSDVSNVKVKTEDKESIASENKLNIKADKLNKANLSDVSNVKVKTEDKESILSENKPNIKADKPAKANLSDVSNIKVTVEDKESIASKDKIKGEKETIFSENKVKLDKSTKANLSDVSNIKITVEDKESFVSENKVNVKSENNLNLGDKNENFVNISKSKDEKLSFTGKVLKEETNAKSDKRSQSDKDKSSISIETQKPEIKDNNKFAEPKVFPKNFTKEDISELRKETSSNKIEIQNHLKNYVSQKNEQKSFISKLKEAEIQKIEGETSIANKAQTIDKTNIQAEPLLKQNSIMGENSSDNKIKFTAGKNFEKQKNEIPKISDESASASNNGIKNSNIKVSNFEQSNNNKPLPSYVINQVGKQIIKSSKNGESEITLQLKPPHLGSLKMKIENNENTLKISIIAEKTSTKEIILSHVSELKSALMEQGLRLDNIDINLSQNFEQSMADAKQEAKNSYERKKNRTGFQKNDNSEGVISEVNENNFIRNNSLNLVA